MVHVRVALVVAVVVKVFLGPVVSAYPYVVVSLRPLSDSSSDGELDGIRRTQAIERFNEGDIGLKRARAKRAFDRLDSSDLGFDLRKKRAFDRIETGEFGFDLRKKRAFDRLESSDFGFDLRKKRAFDRIEDGDFGFDMRKKRAINRLDDGEFSIKRSSSSEEARNELISELAQSLALLHHLRESNSE